MSTIEISVCICTHNPRRHYLRAVLNALSDQTLNPTRWELILVDNMSSRPVSEWIDLSGFPNGRLVIERTLGLTYARLRAIHEAQGELLIFVDDDNILYVDYLLNALEIMREKPFMGALGGRCLGQFERKPPRWSHRFMPYLAVADHGNAPIWAFHLHTYQPWFPYGAGMTIRKNLAVEYSRQLESNPERLEYGRKGNLLTSAEDIDMLFTTLDLGYAIGYFPQLSLKHLIPDQRLTLAYLNRLVFHSHRSSYYLLLARGVYKRPRKWPIAYPSGLIRCLLENDWHPITWLLTVQVTRGKYAAYRNYMQNQGFRSIQPIPIK
jgi:glycosyltransferase involved in cell wall biosynthesis